MGLKNDFFGPYFDIRNRYSCLRKQCASDAKQPRCQWRTLYGLQQPENIGRSINDATVAFNSPSSPRPKSVMTVSIFVIPLATIVAIVFFSLLGLSLWMRQRRRERKSIHNSRVSWPPMTFVTKRNNSFRASSKLSHAYATYEF